MIVGELSDGRLWCVNQTAHALQCEALCRQFGNADFPPPAEATVVAMAVGQHDSGWFEWEAAPEIDEAGRPVDFLHGPAWPVRLAQWERGIRRVFDQHPYAGVLVGRHAALLYDKMLATLPDVGPDERAAVEQFIASQPALVAEARRLLGCDGQLDLSDQAIEADTALLQFGDTSSLVLCVPWPGRAIRVPIDRVGGFTDVRLGTDGRRVTYDPWPFGCDRFEVSVWGRVLDTATFPTHDAYRAALAVAPSLIRRWTVERG